MYLATIFSGIGVAEMAHRKVFGCSGTIFACEIDKFARHNVPMQRYIDRGYFEVTTQTFAGSTGTHQKFTTKITGKGQIALAGKIVEYFKGERI